MGRQRANGEGAVVRIKAKGRKPYAAVITVGWSLEGKPIRKARSASSRAEAKAMLLEMVAARDHQRPLPDDRLTTGKWLREWFHDLRDVRPNTVVTYRSSLRRILPALGGIPLRKLRSSQVEAFLSDERAQGYAANTLSRDKATLSTAIRDAIREGHVQTNVAAAARLPRQPKTKQTAPDQATMRAVLAALEGHRLWPLFRLLAGTGLRIGEATGLRWEDLDGPLVVGADGREAPQLPRLHGDLHEARSGRATSPGAAGASSLTIHYQLQRVQGEHVLTDPKTDAAGRTVVLPAKVQAALREQRVSQARERIAAGRKWRDTDLVFTTAAGQPLPYTTVLAVLHRTCDAAGLERLSLHDFRRYAASEVENALGRDAAQLVLGHTSPSMTANYITVRDETLRRAADALEAAL